MRVTDSNSNTDPRALQPLIDAALSRVLLADDPAPVAVAVSGGGDSLALLILAKSWADRHGRALLALTVDHRLQADASAWARWCARRAERLGVPHRTLVWEGPKPATGLPAAARQARHRLLAAAARAAGARVLLMGHTADDLAESRLMRSAGSTVPDARAWSPSPVWPEGRGLFLSRPLLGARRAEIRAFLAGMGETWIEDPANDNPLLARARARAALAGVVFDDADVADMPAPLPLAEIAEGPTGDLSLPRELLDSRPEARVDLATALLCTSGGDRPPRGPAAARLLARILAGQVFTATLAGARIHSDGALVRIAREVGDRRRPAAASMELPADKTVVWDGRFEVRSSVAGGRIAHLTGKAVGLSKALRALLTKLPPAVRPALPLVIHADGRLTCPTLLDDPNVAIRGLALARLAAARGAIVNEGSLRHMAKITSAS